MSHYCGIHIHEDIVLDLKITLTDDLTQKFNKNRCFHINVKKDKY